MVDYRNAIENFQKQQNVKCTLHREVPSKTRG